MRTTSVDNLVLSDDHNGSIHTYQNAPLHPTNLTGNRKKRFHTIHS